LLHFDSSKRCVCPLYKFLYAFIVIKLFLKHPVFHCIKYMGNFYPSHFLREVILIAV